VKTVASTRNLRRFVPALVAAGTLGLGYADLARGGTTIAPVLLVVGYVVAVPWAIMRTGRDYGAT
jgi:hypothetical protein